ncbi:MAG TPA: S8 family serine peptidase [Candidatus Nitrosotenuis sp.]|jgi:hypothetical protein|nr:S8 family serine peptidase [Candidatus Nitrosotenuis sp.]
MFFIRNRGFIFKFLSFNIALLTLSSAQALDLTWRERMGLPGIGTRKTPPIANKPIKVGVIDDGFDCNHNILSKFLDPNGFNARDDNFDPNISMAVDPYTKISKGKQVDHGTHVAGIIAQIYHKDGSIVPLKIGQNKGEHKNVREQTYKNLFTYLKNRSDIQVINLSWNIWQFDHQYSELYDWIKSLAQLGKMFIFSAGNNGTIFHQESFVKKILSDPIIKSHIIIVGASGQHPISKEKIIADFSAKAGTLHECFITAPGTDIQSTVPMFNVINGTQMKDGTSMAAPAVAGALARLVNETGCTVEQARDAIFATADRPALTSPNFSSFEKTYGHGHLHYENAMAYLVKLMQIQANTRVQTLLNQGATQPTQPSYSAKPNITISDLINACNNTYDDKGGRCLLRPHQYNALKQAWDKFEKTHDQQVFFIDLDNLVKNNKQILGRHAQAVKELFPKSSNS